MDKLNEVSRQLAGKITSQQHYNYNLGETAARKMVVKNYKNRTITVREYPHFYEFGVKVNSEFAFSINRPDQMFRFRIPKTPPDTPFTVYVAEENENSFKDTRLIRFWKSLTDLFDSSQLMPTESVFLYRNAIVFAVSIDRNLLTTLNQIADFVNENEILAPKKIQKDDSLGNIPEKLKLLIPLLKKYAASDDSERDQLIEDLGQKERSRLIATVEPLFGEINGYLDLFNNKPLPEEATLLGNLAELVSELKLR